MPSIEVTISGRKYRMACDEGQEDHLRRLAEDFEGRIAGIRKDLGEIGDARLMVVAALMLADELSDAQTQLAAAQRDLAAATGVSAVASERAQATQAAVIAALNSASERIETVTRELNQSLTESVPMG